MVTAKALGMTFGELDDAKRKGYSIAPEITGVVVTEVDENSAAAEKSVVAGDVITEVAQEAVKTPQDVLDRVAALKEQGRKNALLMIASKTGELRFVTIRID
jgi:serine protease Do